MKSYLVYRNGWTDVKQFPAVLEATLARYANEHGALPKSACVNPVVELDAKEVMRDLGFSVKVRSVGGCLLCEIWLQGPGQ